jgi:hypothetical protein
MAETTPAEHALAFLRELRDLCDRYAVRLRSTDGAAGPVGLRALVVTDAGLSCLTYDRGTPRLVKFDFGHVQRET